MSHICYYSWEVEAGGSGGQGHIQLHNKLEASLGYMKPRVKQTKMGNPGLDSGSRRLQCWECEIGASGLREGAGLTLENQVPGMSRLAWKFHESWYWDSL